MRTCNILAILPYSGLNKLFTKAAGEYPSIAVKFYEKRIPTKDDLIGLVKKEQIDVIISFGSYIYEMASIGLPTVAMQLTFGDLICAFKAAENFSGRHALVCYKLTGKDELKEYAETINQINRRSVYIYDEDEAIAEQLEALKAQKYSVIIGGADTVEQAQRLGINSIQIPYGIESIRNALRSAMLIYENGENIKKRLDIYRKLLNEISEYLVILGRGGGILYHNGDRNLEEFQRLMEKFNKMDELSGPAVFELEDKGIVWSVAKKDSDSINGMTVLCFRQLRFVDATSGGAVTYVNKPDSSILANVYRATNFAHVRDRIKSYQNSKKPILIAGERGLGKEDIAFLLNHERPLVRIDGNNLTLDSFQIFVKEGYNQMLGSNISAILIANADVIAPEIQEPLADFLLNVLGQGTIRVLTTAWEEIYRKVSRGSFSHRLYHLLGEICLDVPPLRNVIGGMDEAISYIISVLNIELGLQTIGIRADALESIKAFSWGGNLQQLVDVLRRSMLASDAPYLSKECVVRMIDMEKSIWSSSRGAAAFWKGSLEEIEKRIIRGILEEEEMNQTRAAKRLGISRSTLWKKIK